ncbi:MAG: ATP-binding protein [Myxococcaceae bacterium]
MRRPIIEEVVAEAHARALPELTHRSVTLPWLPGKIDAVVGMRRSGKTCLMMQKMRELLDSGMPRKSLLYINFEDDRLGELTAAHLAQFVEAHYRLAPAAREKSGAFFFDEIQLVPGWEKFVRRLIDTETVHVCVSGSSAKMLSQEIATSLRGRGLATEVFPFSLVEAMRHHGIPSEQTPSPKRRSGIEHALDTYLQCGGFPEVQRLEESLRVRVLQDYLDIAVLRDVVERHDVHNVHALRKFVHQLVNMPAGLLSIHKIYQDFRSQGVQVGKDSLHNWLGYLEDAFVFFSIPIYSESERVRQTNPRKLYAIDPGLVTACSRHRSANLGQLLETVAFLHLRRQTRDISYLRTSSGFEVDFVSDKGVFQVCAILDEPQTRERELRGLREAMLRLNMRRATIVTLYEADELKVPEGMIRVVPIWRWAMELEGARD